MLGKLKARQSGFTLIELIVVIIIIGLLAAVFLPRYWDVARQARIATLEGVEGSMKSAAAIAKVTALAHGISPADSYPGSDQSAYIIDVEGLNVEVDWYTLCPESDAEEGANSGASMLDFIYIEENAQNASSPIDGTLYAQFDNQFTWVGYDVLPGVNGGAGGCYVEYNSFGTRNVDASCPVTIEITDC